MKLKGITNKGMERIAQMVTPQAETSQSPRIEIAWQENGGYASEWVDLVGKTVEDIQGLLDSHPNSSVFAAEGFGDWDNMEDEPLETIIEAAESILESGSSEDYFRRGI